MMLTVLNERINKLQQELLSAKQTLLFHEDQVEQTKAQLHKISGHIQECAYVIDEAQKKEQSNQGEENEEG